jgi:hypothetical protein
MKLVCRQSNSRHVNTHRVLTAKRPSVISGIGSTNTLSA